MLKLRTTRGGAAVLLLALAVLTACGGAAVEPTATVPPIVVPTQAPTATAAARDLATATPAPTEAPTLAPTAAPPTNTPLPPPSTVTPRPPTAVPPTAVPTSKPKPTRVPVPPTPAPPTRTPVPATPVAPAGTLAVGTWGGQHIALEVTSTGATYDLDCAHGTIDGPIALDAAGHFTARGTYVQEHGGPTRAEETPDSRSVTYTGTVQGDQLSLVLTDVASGTELGKFTLGLGETGRVLKCL
jgi:hypothetical protein